MSESEASSFDGDYGRDYDLLIRQIITGYEAMHRIGLSALETHLPPQAELLVLGSGRGQELCSYAQANSGWRICAVEPSAQMRAVSLARIRELGAEARLRFHAGYLHEMADAEAQFHAATLMLVLHFVADDGAKLALLQELHRRLRPGGLLIYADYFQHEPAGVQTQVFRMWAHQMRANGMLPAVIDKMFEMAARQLHPMTTTRTLELMATAGFRDGIRLFVTLADHCWMFRRE